MSKNFNEIANDFTSLRTRNYLRIWEPFMKKYECDRVCELGVRTGEHFHNLIAHKPKLAVAVDVWRDDGILSHNDLGFSQEDLDGQYKVFQTQVSNLPFVKIIRDFTVNAAKSFQDNYFDFVYIDADHTFDGCYADIVNWYPKVKPGKFLVGHDYRRKFGVKKAVNKFIHDEGLQLIFMRPSTWAVVKK